MHRERNYLKTLILKIYFGCLLKKNKKTKKQKKKHKKKKQTNK